MYRIISCWFSALITIWREGYVGGIYIERSTQEITGTIAHSNIQWWERSLIQYDSAKDTKLHENKLQYCVLYS